MNRSFLIYYYLICFMPVMITFMAMPWIVRRNVFFGVSVPPSAFNDPDLRELRRKYLLWGIILGIITTAIFVALSMVQSESAAVISLTWITFGLIIATFILYVIMWKKAKALKIAKNWEQESTQTVVADTSFYRGKIAISPLWLLMYPVIIGITILVGFYLYDKMPAQVPMQYDFDGTVTRYAEKSYKLLFFLPATQAFLAIVMGFVYWIVRRTRPELDPKDTGKSVKQNTVFRYRWSMFIVFTGALLMLSFLTIQLSYSGVVPIWTAKWIPMGCTLLIVIAVIILSITTGQSGSRVKIVKSTNGGHKEFNRNDDKYWKLGSFYYNPDDPAIFVEKRFGVGFTNNWARPLSWIIIIGFLVIITLVAIFTGELAK